MLIRPLQHIAPMLITIATQRDTDPDASRLSIHTLAETLQLAPATVAAFAEDLTQRGVLTWEGRTVRCPDCLDATFVGNELPTQITCDHGTFPITATIIDDQYRWVLPFPYQSEARWSAHYLTMATLATAWRRSASATPPANTFTFIGPTPADCQIQVVDYGTWYLTPILGSLAYYEYHAQSQYDFHALQLQLVEDLGGQAHYDALSTLQQLPLDPTVGADLLLAGDHLLELPRLAAFAQTASVGLAWAGPRTALATWQPLVDGDGDHHLAVALGARGPACYLSEPPLDAPTVGERQWVWTFPATPARCAAAEQLPQGWCLTQNGHIMATTAMAWTIWRASVAEE